jgi:hypothetical protein
MGFEIHDKCNKKVMIYFGLSSDFKNNSTHMIFRKKSLIDTTRYIYEMRTCFQYDDQQSLISSNKYVNAICNFIKHEQFSPFQDNVIKPWHRSQVNHQKGNSILQKCQNVFKEFIHGTYCLGEGINRSCQILTIPLRFEKHRQLLKTSVLLYILNSVEIKFTYTYKAQYTIKCKHFHYDYLKEEQAGKESITKFHIFNFLHKKVRNHIIYSSRLNAINQEYMTCTEYT